MMKTTTDTVGCVIDRSTFFPVAQRLARGFKRVYYSKPQAESFDTLADFSKGYGHPNVHYLDDFWKKRHEIDLFVFPDCKDDGLQETLKEMGFGVWGSRDMGAVERMRGEWMNVCQDLRLPMPHTEKIKGLSSLSTYLHEREGEKLFVKISRFRGDMETWEAKNPAQVARKLEYLTMRFGPLKETVTFYVQEPVETEIESGADTYFAGGGFPNEVIIGYEKKGESYFATVKDTAKMPDEVWGPMEAIGPMLAEAGYANFISSEIRIADGKSYWLDPCFRCPSPAGEEQLEMYANFPDIVNAGAFGELQQPEWAAKFCGEAVISYCGDREAWKSITVLEEVKQWVKPYACAFHDGAFHFPPSQEPEAIGCAVGMGDTPEEVVEHLKEIEEALKGEPVELHIEPLADLFKEIEKAENEGIEFSGHEMPEPAIVLET